MVGGTFDEVDVGTEKLRYFYLFAAATFECERLARGHLVAKEGHDLYAFGFVIVNFNISLHK